MYIEGSDLGTTDIHSCNSSARKPERKNIHQLPTPDTGQNVYATKKSQGYLSTQQAGAF